MRILFVSNLFPPVQSGGYEIECKQVADTLFSWGHDVSILTSDYQSQNIQEVALYPVHRVLELLLPFDEPVLSAMRVRRSVTHWFNQRKTLEVIRKTKPDIVYLWSQLRIGMGSARAAIEAQVPYGWRIGDLFLAGFVPSPLVLNMQGLYRYFSDHFLFPKYSLTGIRFQHVSCVSAAVRTLLLKSGVPFEQAEVIYKGIPLDQFPSKNALGNLSHPAKILFTGRLHPEKGVPTLIQAAHAVAQTSKTPISVTLAGTGAPDYLLELQHLAKQGKANIQFLGQVDYQTLGPLYQSHDLFVFPSIISEGFGATIQEAMASGLPVISTGHGGQGELLLDTENSLVFPAGDAPALSQSIQRLIDDDLLRRKLALAGRQLAESTYSMEAYGRATERFLLKALEPGSSEPAQKLDETGFGPATGHQTK